MRASDRDREASLAALRGAYVRGELSTQTLDWRLELALGARTREQLERLTRDIALPVWRRLRRRLSAAPERTLSLMTLEAETAIDELVLGRSAACSVHLDEPTVSRRHAVVRRRDGVWTVQDLGSTNGTYLNGAPVTAAPLLPGDVLEIGAVRLRVA